MPDEIRGIHVSRDVMEPSPALREALDELAASIDAQTAATRAQISSMATGVEDRVLAGLSLSLQHLDPVVLQHTAAVADALACSGIGEQFMLRTIERSRTDPEFVQVADRADAAVRENHDAAVAIQRLEDMMYERPELLTELRNRLPAGVSVRTFLSVITLGMTGYAMFADGFTENDQVQITAEITDRSPDFLPKFTRKKSGKDFDNTGE
ncbi:hypothetical protein ACFYE2_08010 [Kocuria sp. CPCC 205300]|uniref:hypothetical protein n=1 Tax=Kocuria sabuli TaxID=3071448 RepID=UPI0036DB4107